MLLTADGIGTNEIMVGTNDGEFREHCVDQETLPAHDRRPSITNDRYDRYRVLAFLDDKSAYHATFTLEEEGKPAVHLAPGELFTVVRDASEIEIGEEDPKVAIAVKELFAGVNLIIERSQIDPIVERLKAANSAVVVCVCLNELYAIAKRAGKLGLWDDDPLLANGIDLEEMSWAAEIPECMPDFVVAVHRDGNAILRREDGLLDPGPWTYAPVEEPIAA